MANEVIVSKHTLENCSNLPDCCCWYALSEQHHLHAQSPISSGYDHYSCAPVRQIIRFISIQIASPFCNRIGFSGKPDLFFACIYFDTFGSCFSNRILVDITNQISSYSVRKLYASPTRTSFFFSINLLKV